MRFFILTICFFFFLTSNLFASNEYSVVQINPSRNFPVSEISEIFFDEHGVMWLGTNKGLLCYDGYSINKLELDTLGIKVLSYDYIIDISEDNNGNFWILTRYGIEKFNTRIGIAQFSLPVKNSSKALSISYSHANQDVYITFDSSVLRFSIDNNAIDTVYSSQTRIIGKPIVLDNTLLIAEESNLIELDLLSLSLEKTNYSQPVTASVCLQQFLDKEHLLVTLNNVLFSYNLASNDFVEIHKFQNNISGLSQVKNRQVIVNTIDDVFLLNLNIEEYEADIELLNTFKPDVIKSTAIDNNGVIWVATNTDIIKINPYSKNFRYSPFLNAKLLEQYKNSVVFESSKRGVIYKDDDGTITFYHSSKDTYYKLPLSEANSACLLGKELFIGYSKGLKRVNLSTLEITELAEGMQVNNVRLIEDKVWVAAEEGIFYINKSVLNEKCVSPSLDIFSSGDNLFQISDNGLGVVDLSSCKIEMIVHDEFSEIQSPINDVLQSYDGKTWIATQKGLYQFIYDTSKSVEQQFVKIHPGSVYSIIEAVELPEIWFSTDMGLGAFDYQKERIMTFTHSDGVLRKPFLARGAYHDLGSTLNFVAGDQKVSLSPQNIFKIDVSPEVIISNANFVSINAAERKYNYSSDTIVVNPDIRFFELFLTIKNFYSPKNIKYEYSLTPIGEEPIWQDVLDENKISVGRLTPGKYKLLISARNSHGLESVKAKQIIVLVNVPLLQSKWAYFLYFVTVIFMVVLLIRLRTRHLTKINREYKEKEIIAKKIEVQKEELTLKNKNITDSINYARRIQLAMMPSVRLFKSIFPDSFILHMPKDIVSGDFYWINQVGDKTFFSAVDCTGHGVPGAFMSIIGVELFRRITEIEGISTPADVLNSLSRNFERVFGDVDEMKLRDGMDLAFCTLNSDHTILEFAGAFNPLYIIRDSSILDIKGDRHSVGVYEDDDTIRSFNNHVIPLQDGDTIYIFTDGFADQFGGPEGKKYKYRRFRHLLLALHQLPMEEQKEFLRKSMEEWKGDLDQVDDILVMSLKIHQKKRAKH